MMCWLRWYVYDYFVCFRYSYEWTEKKMFILPSVIRDMYYKYIHIIGR